MEIGGLSGKVYVNSITSYIDILGVKRLVDVSDKLNFDELIQQIWKAKTHVDDKLCADMSVIHKTTSEVHTYLCSNIFIIFSHLRIQQLTRLISQLATASTYLLLRSSVLMFVEASNFGKASKSTANTQHLQCTKSQELSVISQILSLTKFKIAATTHPSSPQSLANLTPQARKHSSISINHNIPTAPIISLPLPPSIAHWKKILTPRHIIQRINKMPRRRASPCLGISKAIRPLALKNISNYQVPIKSNVGSKSSNKHPNTHRLF